MLENINIHSIIRGSKVNGIGNRYVLWVQGCSKKCPECYNKNFRKKRGGILYKVEELAYNIINSGLDGVTISGGEPFDQSVPLYKLLVILNQNIEKLPYGIIVFTGYTMNKLLKDPLKARCLDLIDLVITGRYIQELRQTKCLSGSSNQEFYYLEKENRGKDLVTEIDYDQGVEVHMCTTPSCFIVTGFPILNETKLKKNGIEIIE